MVDKNVDNKVSVVKNLLSRAVKAMEGLDDGPESSRKLSRASRSNQPTNSTWKTEMDRLFPNVFSSNSKRRALPTGTFSSHKKRCGSLTKKKEKTVTRKFVRLADKGQMEIPSVQEIREFFLSGLGEKIYSF